MNFMKNLWGILHAWKELWLQPVPMERMEPRRKVLFFLITWIVVLGTTAIVGELVLRVIVSRRLIYNIEMVKYANALKMASTNPDVSHVHRPGATARLMGVDIALNSLGNRGRDLGRKSPDVKRILVLGSSVTFGWGVETSKVFTSVLEKELNVRQPFGPGWTFEFANAGIGNYNTKFQLALFKQQYPVLKPDMVLLHYFIRDVEPIEKKKNNPILKHSYLAAYLYDRSRVVFEVVLNRRFDLFEHYRRLYRPDSRQWNETLACIEQMRETLAKDSVPLVIMIIPDIHNLAPGSPYQQLYGEMQAAFDRQLIPTLNAFEDFQRQFGGQEKLLWVQPDDPHPNAAGHQLMADLLYRYFVDHDPLRLLGSTQF